MFGYRDKVCGQFDIDTDTTVTNLLLGLHNCKAYDHKFKYPVGLTSSYPLGQGYYLYIPISTLCGYPVIL